ncbi:hypothetical protein AX15_007324 [Amanita polypyramis BW_CC]|nr:hypothetical protein AX15_007324 [Amanita polypyramis BW_CC]
MCFTSDTASAARQKKLLKPNRNKRVGTDLAPAAAVVTCPSQPQLYPNYRRMTRRFAPPLLSIRCSLNNQRLHRRRQTMPFLKGLFRVAASSTEKQASGWHSVDALPGPHDQGQEHSFPTCSSSIQTSSTFRRRGSDIDDRELFSPPSPAFHGSWRPRSLSETGIIRSPGSSRSASFTSLSLSPPSSPLSSSGANRLSNSSVASLSSSEKFENRINKQLQKKTSSSNLRFGHLSFEMDSGRIDKKRMKPVRRSTFPLNDTVLGISGSDIENGDGGRRKGCSHICDSSMDFQCRGLPDSGTFSKLTDAEAAVRAEDELATIQRLQVGRHS